MSPETHADPIATLLAQHRAAEARFAAFGAGSARDAGAIGTATAAAESLLAYVEGALETHIRLEEEQLFPRLRQAATPWDANLIEQMIAGHDQIRRKRSDLQAAITARQGDAALESERPPLRETVAALHQTLRMHFQNEEDLVFRLVPELLDPNVTAAIGRTIAAASSTMEEQEMTESEHTPPLRGETTGTPERPTRQVSAPVLRFDLPAEIERLHQESGWINGERDGKTLVKEPDFRIVLTAMKSGTRLAQHKTAARVSIQLLSGRIAVSVGGQTNELSAGHLVVLDREIPHEVVALVDSAFLLTLAWPERGEDAEPDSRQ